MVWKTISIKQLIFYILFLFVSSALLNAEDIKPVNKTPKLGSGDIVKKYGVPYLLVKEINSFGQIYFRGLFDAIKLRSQLKLTEETQLITIVFDHNWKIVRILYDNHIEAYLDYSAPSINLLEE